jgi:hypothetical protein
MIYEVNPPLAIPASQPPAESVTEYAYYREVMGERRPAKALGKWADVWSRVEVEDPRHPAAHTTY